MGKAEYGNMCAFWEHGPDGFHRYHPSAPPIVYYAARYSRAVARRLLLTCSQHDLLRLSGARR